METINRDNYEAYLLDREEGTLTSEREKALEKFLKDNPDLQEDASFISDDGLKVQYAVNEDFSRKSELLRPVFTFSKRMKAVAVVLVVIATGYFAYTLTDFTPAGKPSDRTLSPTAQTDKPKILTNDNVTVSVLPAEAINAKSATVNGQSAPKQESEQDVQITENNKEQPVLIVQKSEPATEKAKEDTEPMNNANQMPNMIVYKTSDIQQSQDLIAYKQSAPSKWAKAKHKVAEFINKTKV